MKRFAIVKSLLRGYHEKNLKDQTGQPIPDCVFEDAMKELIKADTTIIILSFSLILMSFVLLLSVVL